MKAVLAWTLAAHLAFWLFWPLAALLLAAGVVVSLRKDRRRLILLILLSPWVVVPTLSFAGGVVGYLHGEARLRTFGMPGPEFHNLDREMRCYHSTSGCVVDGSETFTQSPNNVAVRWMIALFGPMPGAYCGPYPTRAESWALVDAAPTRVPAASLPRSVWEFARGGQGDWAVVDLQGQATLFADTRQAFLIEQGRGRLIARYVR